MGVGIMHWLCRNAIGLLGLALAVAAFAIGVDAYRTSLQRDEQARAIPLRLELGEADLAEQHKKGVAALSSLVDVLRPLTYYVAVLATVVGVWDARRRQASLWLIGATIVLAVVAVGFALRSRA